MGCELDPQVVWGDVSDHRAELLCLQLARESASERIEDGLSLIR